MKKITTSSEQSRDPRSLNAYYFGGVAVSLSLSLALVSALVISEHNKEDTAAVLTHNLAAPIKADGFIMEGLDRATYYDFKDGESANNTALVALKVGAGCVFESVKIHYTGTPDKIMDVVDYNYTTYPGGVVGESHRVKPYYRDVKTITGMAVTHTFKNSADFANDISNPANCIPLVEQVNLTNTYEHIG